MWTFDQTTPEFLAGPYREQRTWGDWGAGVLFLAILVTEIVLLARAL